MELLIRIKMNSGDNTLKSVIFVCTGNICRSPMAEGILRKRLLEQGRGDIRVLSMGIHGLDNQPASQTAIETCLEHGIDISGHQSRPLVADELKSADAVFTMELVQKEFLRVFFPQVIDRTFLLGCWPQRDARKGNIKDPIGGNTKEYRKAYAAIDAHIERILPHLIEAICG